MFFKFQLQARKRKLQKNDLGESTKIFFKPYMKPKLILYFRLDPQLITLLYPQISSLSHLQRNHPLFFLFLINFIEQNLILLQISAILDIKLSSCIVDHNQKN